MWSIVLATLFACALAQQEAVPTWKIVACQRTNNRLNFCPELVAAGIVSGEVETTEAPTTSVTWPSTTTRAPTTQAPTTTVDLRELGNLPDVTTPEPMPDPRCSQYRQRYDHFCGNITSQPLNLRADLRKYCPIYEEKCALFLNQRNDFDQLPEIAGPPPTTPLPDLAPCTYNCTAEHCTRQCKCEYYRPQMAHRCLPSNMIPLWQQNCKLWYKSCKDLYEIPPEYLQGGETGPNGQRSDPDAHTGFWDNNDDTDVDWQDGRVKTGNDWQVPGVGIGGTTNQNDIAFPSVGRWIGRRRRRAILARMHRQ